MHIFQIIKYLFYLNKREPLSFLFNLMLPLGIFFSILFYQRESMTSFQDAVSVLYSLSAYTIYSSAAYGVGVAFADWRESGLFLTYCKSRRAVWRLLCGQSLLRSIASGAYVMVFIAAAAAYFQSGVNELWIILPVVCFFLSLGACFFSLGFLLLPISPKDLSAIISVSIFCLLALSVLGHRYDTPYHILEIINLVNPINWNTVILHRLIEDSNPITLPSLFKLSISALIFISIGFFGISRFRPHPILARL